MSTIFIYDQFEFTVELQDKAAVLKVWEKLTDEEKFIIESLMRFGANIQGLKPAAALEISRLFCLRIYRSTKVCRPFLLKGEITFMMDNFDIILNNGIFYGDLKGIANLYNELEFFKNWLDQIIVSYDVHNLASSFKLDILSPADKQEYVELKNRVHQAPSEPIADGEKKFLFGLVCDFIVALKTNFFSGLRLRNLVIVVGCKCLSSILFLPRQLNFTS